MLLTITIIFAILAIAFTTLPFFKLFKTEYNFKALMVVFWILFAISFAGCITLTYLIQKGESIEQRIKIYEEQNTAILLDLKHAETSMQDVANTISNSLEETKQKIEQYIQPLLDNNALMRCTSNEGDMNIEFSINYPDINIDVESLYKYLVECYNYNCMQISKLQEQSYYTSVYRHLLNFGK